MSDPKNSLALSHLSIADRMLLAHAVIDSAIAEAQSAAVTADQMDEIRRCDEAIDSGDMKCELWSVVRRRLLSDQ